MHVRLKIMQGSNQGKEVKVPTPKCIIGRGEDCQLRLHNDAVSRHHCIIVTTENEVVVRDQKSRNGTFVNDEQVAEEPAVLLHGDVLRVGPYQFEMIIEQSVAKPKRPKIADIKEAVARTAEGNGAASTSDLEDVTSWLEEADTHEKSRRTSDPETRQFRLDDTVTPAQISATAETKTVVTEAKRPDKKPPGKLPPRPTTSKADSREAAADMLKKFFNRR